MRQLIRSIAERGLAAPFLFLALAVAAKGSVEASPSLWLLALAFLGCAFALIPSDGTRVGATPIGVSALFFAGWMMATNRWLNPSYTAAGTFHALFLAGGFLLGRRAGRGRASTLFVAGIAFALLLAAWAFWQRVGEGAGRASALFETPATFGSVINLVLLPAAAVALWGPRRPLLIGILVILLAGVAAAGSRGGWLALGGAFAGIALTAHRLALARVSGRRLVFFAAAAAAVLVVALSTGYSMFGAEAARSSAARLGMYQLALANLAPSSLPAGIGYLGFYYLMEHGRYAIPTYEHGSTYFVHNDYLQTLLELGVPGFAAMLAMVALPIAMLWRAAPGLRSGPDRILLLAVLGALLSADFHALVDFPFYIPVCLLMYGCALGVLDALLARGGRVAAPAGPWLQAGRAAAVALAAWLLLMPVLAEAAAAFAQRQWREGDAQSAAYWFEAARRIEPRDWRYHWYAGQFWYMQAAQSRRPRAARLADEAFAAGVAANPREPRNSRGRAAVRSELLPLLLSPAK